MGTLRAIHKGGSKMITVITGLVTVGLFFYLLYVLFEGEQK